MKRVKTLDWQAFAKFHVGLPATRLATLLGLRQGVLSRDEVPRFAPAPARWRSAMASRQRVGRR